MILIGDKLRKLRNDGTKTTWGNGRGIINTNIKL